MTKTLQQVNKENAELRKQVKELLGVHAKDQRELNEYKTAFDDAVKEISDAYNIWMKAVVEQFGEPVQDDETQELIGKRLEFYVKRADTSKFNMRSELPEERDRDVYLAKMTWGVTYAQEKGEES